MAADWDEVKRLAADFQRAQLSSSFQRLSERNCIEIVKKLLELRLIDVIFTTDGKEYITPQYLLKEMKDELILHGGRINLVELSQILGIDFSHIETKANDLVKADPSLDIVLGQLIDSEYLDRLAEEINEKLQQQGHITIGELAKQYDLPGDFLQECIYNRLHTIIQGHPDQSDSRTLFTEAYVSQQKSIIRGILSAVTRPVAVSSLINHFKLTERLFYTIADSLISEGRLPGSLTGGRTERATYIPNIYAQSQNEWVDSFYKQNGYLEYDAITRLGISDPKSYITRRYKDESISFLGSCCVGKTILAQVEAVIEEALNSGLWVDVLPVLPSVFTSEDALQIIKCALKSQSKRNTNYQIFDNTIIASDNLIQTCLKTFDPILISKAEKESQKGIHSVTAVQASKYGTKPDKSEETTHKGKPDKKEERRKKATGGKSGGGVQGRETKSKSVKKKYRGGRGEDSDSDDDTQSSYSGKDGGKKPEIQFLNLQEIEDHLEKLTVLKECPDSLLKSLAENMHRPLTKKYQETVMSVFLASAAASGATRRKTFSELQDKCNLLLANLHIFEKGLKNFPDDVQVQLNKYLLKTLCTEVTDMAIIYLAGEQGIIYDSDKNSLSIESRHKLITKFPAELMEPLMKLHNSLNSKTIEDFQAQIDTVLGADICSMIIRKVDKKKERQLLSNQRQSLLSQLSETSDPALCLHLAVLLIYYTQTHSMLHASGKFVPQIILFLQKQIPLDLYQILTEYQELVVQTFTLEENNEEKEQVKTRLTELMPKIKEIAITYRKSSLTDPDV